jgi:parvulin-like peptidyl-prolyl isomerase
MTQQASQLQLQRQRLPESIMSELVEDRVVQREAARRGIEVGPGDIDERVRKLVAEAQAASEPEPGPTATLTEDRFGPALQDTLKRSGFTEAQLRGLARDEIYDERLRELLGQEVPAQQEHVLARHIVFRDEAEVNDALGQLQGGASFEELARTRSLDQATRDKGGDLGWLPRLGRDPAFDEALFALQPGQLSGVVRTDSGWEIVQVIDRDPARAVDETQLDEMRRRHYGTWLAAAVGSPEIERSLTPEISSWVLQRAAARRS